MAIREVSDLVEAREALGGELRRLRREAGLTSRQLAESCGWLPSKVSQIENGKQTPSSRDINSWTEVALAPQAAPALREQLLSLESFYRDWRRQSASGVSFAQKRWLDMESKVRYLRVFEPHFVPGLLQTAEYARGRLAAHAHLHDAPDDVDEAVRLRLQRQEILYQTERQFFFLVAEFGLRSGAYATAGEMVTQIEQLISAMSHRNVDIGVISRQTEWGVNVDHGFWIFDDDHVLVEVVTAELRLAQPDELATYRRVFQRLSDEAMHGDDAQSLLSRIASDLRQEL